MSPGKKSLTFEPTSDDFADELVADGHGHRNGVLRPLVPIVDMDIGAADAGVADAYQHVVDSDFWFGDILKPKALLGLALD